MNGIPLAIGSISFLANMWAYSVYDTVFNLGAAVASLVIGIVFTVVS